MPLLDFLFTARPTAVNLGAATRRLSKLLQAAVEAGTDPISTSLDLVSEGRRISDEDVGRNKAMSKWGGDWLIDRLKQEGRSGEKLNVLTVCNTGSLATSVSVLLPAQLNLYSHITQGYGTAFGLMTYLHETGQLDSAYYTQTAPYHQGSR
jgi:methylthioribose-1-phosphate isomerase